MIPKSIRLLTLMLMVVGCIGCASLPNTDSGDTERTSKLVALNLVDAFTQLVSPDEIVLTLSRKALTHYAGEALLRAGFAVRLVADEYVYTGKRLTLQEQARIGRHEYVLRYGELTLHRRYASGSDVYPVSPLYISGVGSVVVELDDEIFGSIDKRDYVSSVVVIRGKRLISKQTAP